ncbi:MAG: Hemolysin C [Chlamydiae bacterium]|nr:Hemolysin C [Chlamydiota bacterium]
MTCLTFLILFLILSLLNVGFSTAVRTLPMTSIKKFFGQYNHLFFYFPIHKRLFQPYEMQSLYFFSEWNKSFLIFLYAISSVCAQNTLFSFQLLYQQALAVIALVFILILLQSFIEMLAYRYSKKVLLTIGPIVSLLYLLTIPLAYLFLKLQLVSLHKMPKKSPHTRKIEELLESLKDSKTTSADSSEHKLIESVLSLRKTKVREVMQPRIDLFAIEASTLIKDVIKECIEEGYSRVPIYKEELDNIVGVLMIKDILEVIEDKEKLQKPVETLTIKPLFTPESKSIALLLQEFRSKHTHIAIVVDEYGGTKGVVTIEDILEEIVGEIEDEYDIDEDVEFFPLPSGGYVVDSTMSINDIEEKLKIKIPSDGDYDTLGGFVFHRAGIIPEKGFVIETDDFKIEILSSNERKIDKIKLISKHKK